jgi:hypothetical protein
MCRRPHCLVHLICCPLVALVLVFLGTFGAQLSNIIQQRSVLEEFHTEQCTVSQVTAPNDLPPAPGWIPGSPSCPAQSRWASCVRIVSAQYGLIRNDYPDQDPCTYTGDCTEAYDRQLEWAKLTRDSWLLTNQTVCYQRNGIAYLMVSGPTSLGEEQHQLEKIFALLVCLACLSVCGWVIFAREDRSASPQSEPLLPVQIESNNRK